MEDYGSLSHKVVHIIRHYLKQERNYVGNKKS